MANLSEGDIVLCIVERIEGTTVFVRIEETKEQGTVTTSEIAPGRIRNLRDYVSPKRRIVCKILRIEGNNIHLSLRRVTPKENKEIMDKYEKERNSLGILRSVLGQEAEKVAEEIKKSGSLTDFLNNCRTNPEKLGAYLAKEHAERVCKILAEKKDKKVEVKREFQLSSRQPDGIITTKSILASCAGNCNAGYIAAGRFAIKIKAKDYKEANSEINKALENIKKLAKEKKMDFSVKE